MRKIILIAVAILLLAGVIGTGTVVLAQSNSTPAINSQAGQANLTIGQVLRRLVLIQNEAKVDSLLATAVGDGKLSKEQAAKIKTFWLNNHAKAAKLVKRIIINRLLNVKDEAKLKTFLDNQVGTHRITQTQENQMINLWESINK